MRAPSRIVIMVASITMLIAAFAVPAHASAASTLLSRINASRANAGQAPVEMYWDLTDDAMAHTDAMMSSGGIFHSSSLAGVTGVWQALGENVGVGTDANQLHDAFMASSSHKGNILGNYNYVGIGTKVDGDGLLWATIIFMRAEPGLNGGAETTTTTTTTTTTAAVPATEPAPATTTTTLAPAVGAVAPTPLTVPAAVRAGQATAAQTDAGATAHRFEAYGHPDGLPAFAI